MGYSLRQVGGIGCPRREKSVFLLLHFLNEDVAGVGKGVVGIGFLR